MGRKEDGRERILASAGRGFRKLGYGGLGVDGLAKEAGVTSGAFYAHFKSKAEAFREAVVAGLRDLRTAVERMRTERGTDWRESFIDFYLIDRRTCDLADSCALQSLTAEVARGGENVRRAYEAELRKVIDEVAAGLKGANKGDRRSEAVALLAILAGGVSIARAVEDPTLSAEIADGVRWATAKITGDRARPADQE